MGIVIVVLILALMVGIPAFIAYQAGKSRGWQDAASRTPPRVTTLPREAVIRAMLRELDGSPISEFVPYAQRKRIRARYEAMLAPPAQIPVIPATPHLTVPRETTPVVATLPEPAPAKAAAPAPRVARPTRVRTALEPAVILLYVGGLLVVAAGLTYASYAWADLGPWQKMGMLIAATALFIAAGLALLPHPRVRQAGETYLAIGALLVPTNAIAAYTVIEGAQARPELPLLFGAAATALVHGAFSIRPGGILYSYAAVLATALTLATIPAAFGEGTGWGAVTLLLAVALVPVPDGPLAHLARAWTLMSIAAIPIAIAISQLTTWDDNLWLPTALLAAITLVLLRFDRMWLNDIGLFAGIATFAALATTVFTLVALDVESAATVALVFAALGVTWFLLPVAVPAWGGRGFLLAALVYEGTGVLGVAVSLMADVDRPTTASLLALAAIAATGVHALHAGRRQALMLPAAFTLTLYTTLAAYHDPGAWTRDESLRFGIPAALILAALAFALDRSRDRRGVWVWLMAAVTGLFCLVDALSLLHLTDGNLRLAAIAALYAVPVLAGAWSLRFPPARIGYGALGVIALFFALLETSLVRADLLPALLAGSLALALPSIPPVARALASRIRLFRPWAEPQPPHELRVIAAVAVAILATMTLVAGAYIASGAAGDALGIDTSAATWPLYLLVFAAIATAATAIGLRGIDLPGVQDKTSASLLPYAALVSGAGALALATRMLTTDLMVWTWIALATALAITGATLRMPTANTFLARLHRIFTLGGPILGAAAILANLEIAVQPARPHHDAAQVAVYLILAAALAAFATRTRRSAPIGASAAATGVALLFAVRALDGDLTDTAIAFAVLAWVIALAAIPLARRASLAWQQPHWTKTALASGAAAIGLALPAAVSTDAVTRADSIHALTWLSLAALLAVTGTRARDHRRTLLATLAGIPAVMTATWALDGDIYRVILLVLVYGWALLGTLLASQRLAPATWPRQHGTVTGISATAVALALTLGQRAEGNLTATEPWVVLGLVSMAGMLAVDAVFHEDRLRAVFASLFGLAALLVQIGTRDPADIHAYTLPLATYLLILGFLFRRHGTISHPLLAIGAGVLVVPTLVSAFEEETFRWLLYAGAEGLALLFGGLLTRLRVPIAAGVATISVLVLRMLVDAANALPSWVSLLIAGVALLILGTAWLTYRDDLRKRFGTAREHWAHLG